MAKRIAVLGASNDRSKFGNKAVRAYLSAGWEVVPVNPHEETIEGLSVHRSLAEIGQPLERISVYLPPAVTRGELGRIADAAATEVWFNPGSADPDVLRAAEERSLNYVDGCSIVDIGLSPAQFP